MTQKEIAGMLGYTKQHWSEVLSGRIDAGKKLAGAAVKMFGGPVEVWLYESGRTRRREIVNNYIKRGR